MPTSNGEPAEQVGLEDNRERVQLIAAAERVLARGSWWGFKLEAVLREARLSTRSFYRHFDGKDALLSAVLEGELLATADYVRTLCDATSSPVERVWQYVGALLDLASDEQITKPASLLASSWRRLMPEYTAVTERCADALTAPLADALDAGHRAGLLTCPDPGSEAKAIFFLIGSAFYDLPKVSSEESRDFADRVIVPFVARALGLAAPNRVSRRPVPLPERRPNRPGVEFTMATHAWAASRSGTPPSAGTSA